MKFALLLLLAQEEDKENRKFYGRYTRMLTLEERRRRDRRIPRSALRPHCESPFRYLFNSGNDQGLINATGLDFEVFNELLTIFNLIHSHGHCYCSRSWLIVAVVVDCCDAVMVDCCDGGRG